MPPTLSWLPIHLNFIQLTTSINGSGVSAISHTRRHWLEFLTTCVFPSFGNVMKRNEAKILCTGFYILQVMICGAMTMRWGCLKVTEGKSLKSVVANRTRLIRALWNVVVFSIALSTIDVFGYSFLAVVFVEVVEAKAGLDIANGSLTRSIF